MRRYIHVAGINRGPCVLKHHRWNHGRPRVGFGGILGVPSIEPLWGGGGGSDGSNLCATQGVGGGGSEL